MDKNTREGQNVPDSGSWDRYQKLVLSELQRLNDNLEKIAEKTERNSIEMSAMKMKTSILAAIMGTLSAIATSILSTLGKN